MIIKTSMLFFLIALFPITAFCQTDFSKIKSKRIRIIPIDTTETFIYETKEAKLTFSQSDIIDYFSKQLDEYKIVYQLFIDTLIQNNKTIEIISDSIYDQVFEFNRGNGIIEKGKFSSGKDNRDYLRHVFREVAAELILQGKVLPFSKKNGKFETKFVFAKKINGIMGNRFLAFKFPNDTQFYSVATILGE